MGESGGEEESGEAIGRMDSFSKGGEKREDILEMEAKDPARNVGLRVAVAEMGIAKEEERERGVGVEREGE